MLRRFRVGSVLVLSGAILLLVCAPNSIAATYEGVLTKDTSGCCTIHGTRSSIQFYGWVTQAVTNYQAVKVLARNSDGSVHVQSGAEASFGEGFQGCMNTAGALESYVEWNDGTNEGCALIGGISATHVYKVILKCATCTKWRMYVDSVNEATSNGLVSNPSNIRAGGQSDAQSQSYAITNFGTTTDWQRTAQADDVTPTWTTITSSDSKIQQGLWTVGSLPDPFEVDDNA